MNDFTGAAPEIHDGSRSGTPPVDGAPDPESADRVSEIRALLAAHDWDGLDRIASRAPAALINPEVRPELDLVTSGYVPGHRDVPAFTIIAMAVQTENAVVTPLARSILLEARSGMRRRLEGEPSSSSRSTALALIGMADERLGDLDDLLATALELERTLDLVFEKEIDSIDSETPWHLLRLGLAWVQLDRHQAIRRAFTSLITLVPPSSRLGRLARSALGIVLDPRFWAVDERVDAFASRGASGDEFLDEFVSRNRIYRSIRVVQAFSLVHQLIRQSHIADALRVLYAIFPRTEEPCDWPGLVSAMIPLLIMEGDIEPAVDLAIAFFDHRSGDADPAGYWVTLFGIIAWTRAGRDDLVRSFAPTLMRSTTPPAIAGQAIIADLSGDRALMRSLQDDLETLARAGGTGLIRVCVDFLTLVRNIEDGDTAAVARASSRFGDALAAPYLVTAFEMLSNTTLDSMLAAPPHESTARVRAVIQLVRQRRSVEHTILRSAGEPTPGNVHLTRREAEILLQFRAGKTNRQIAEDAFISINTVKTQVRGLFAKLGVSSRAGALEVVVNRGLLPPAP